MGGFENILVEVERGRARITLNRPEKRNALSIKLLEELSEAPPDLLEAEVEGLADRLALVDADLLAANRRIINLGLELMGARTLQRLACENDARGHLAASARGFIKNAAEKSLKAALMERDAKFGDGRARVNGPELRDEKGRLRDL
jgi:enoyl-CoA hydratase